ncbi:hypothetical protein [uncultured Veillonella sp.]|uniref:hypothetical protein n=1 Tax=uncultured Veillonella sp. TaxID=159268 RepID=UPI003211AE74
MLRSVEGRLFAFQRPAEVEQPLAYAVHHTFALCNSRHFDLVGHAEDGHDRFGTVFGTCFHDAVGNIGVVDGAGDGHFACVVVRLFCQYVIVQVDS